MMAINATERTDNFHMQKGDQRFLLFTIDGYGWPLMAANRTDNGRLVLREFGFIVDAAVALLVVAVAFVVYRLIRVKLLTRHD